MPSARRSSTCRTDAAASVVALNAWRRVTRTFDRLINVERCRNLLDYLHRPRARPDGRVYIHGAPASDGVWNKGSAGLPRALDRRASRAGWATGVCRPHYVLLSPHLVVCDLVLLLPAVLYLLERRDTPTVRVAPFFLFVITWMAPVGHLVADLDRRCRVGAVPILVLWLEFRRSDWEPESPQR